MEISKKISIIISSITLVICLTIYFLSGFNAYEVKVNNKIIAYVSNRNDYNAAYSSFMSELKERFGNSIKLVDDVKLNKCRVNNKYIVNSNQVKNLLQKNVNVQGFAMDISSNGAHLCCVSNKDEYKKIVAILAEKQLKDKDAQIETIFINNKLSYNKILTNVCNIKSVDKIANQMWIKKYKEASITIKYLKHSIETIPSKTIITTSQQVKDGSQTIKSEGKDGIKDVLNEFTLNNNDVVGKTVIKTTIIRKPKDKIILKGKEDELTFLTPSRGTLSSEFGYRWGKMHKGVDIAAAMGTPIYAAADGEVICSEVESGYGNVIKIEHNNCLETIYGHCSKIITSKGKKVSKGELIGYVGSTGRSTGPHLHFEIKKNGVSVNPLKYIKVGSYCYNNKKEVLN